MSEIQAREHPAKGEARPPVDSVCKEAGFTRCAARLLDVLGAGIAICDGGGTMLYLNPTGGTILGITSAMAVGVDIKEVFAPLPRLLAELEACPQGASPEISVCTKAGRQILVGYRMASTEGLTTEGSGAPHEALTQQIILFQDITDFARVREERDHLLKVATVSRILPTIAHEIKNPLAGIQCLAESLQHELSSKDHREDLGVILTEVERMRLIIDGLGLAGGSLLSGAVESDLGTEIGALLRMLQPRAEQLAIHLVGDCKVTEPVCINRSMLRLVLLNLVNNALEACAGGGRVTVTATRDHQGLQLVVDDTGCGMDPELAARATELFYTTKPGGSGIGLALINQVVQRDNGELEITSRPGVGTTVRLWLAQEEGA